MASFAASRSPWKNEMVFDFELVTWLLIWQYYLQNAKHFENYALKKFKSLLPNKIVYYQAKITSSEDIGGAEGI